MTLLEFFLSGAYLLSVTWSGQHVSGSPFKVSVMSASDASKVTCSGDGLKSIVCGREGSVLIDTRSAGPGLHSAWLFDEITVIH